MYLSIVPEYISVIKYYQLYIGVSSENYVTTAIKELIYVAMLCTCHGHAHSEWIYYMYLYSANGRPA